ncbi:heme anaerobic degradation radical SAM methyltransferase ChuW/HutW [Vibrio aerogenes]|nr:heme anaerobic degradation radical SAM methyltransferase ChuW/HutW [Vibrio aerogenes]
MINIDFDDETLTGTHSSDPLRHAFSRKKSAHAGMAGAPVPFPDIQRTVTEALSIRAPENKNRCLYIHIPFCRVRCTYCNFFQNASSQQLVDSYFAALLQELEWKASFAWSQSAPFQAVYIGGGTPSDLSPQQIRQLAQHIKRLYPLAPDCEITLEGRLNRFDNEKFEHALEGGINRFSFGVQSFDTTVRKAARRLDSRDYLLARISALTGYNAAPIVLDLLYGLPMQTLDIWHDDLRDYLASGADGVDLYQLIEMPGIPLEKKVAQGKLPPAGSTQLKATMYETGSIFMARHHQKKLSINHWASTNRERSLYNSLAKTSADVLPVGAGAGGHLAGLQLMQFRKLEDYMQAIGNRQFPMGMIFRETPAAGIFAEIKSGMDQGVLSRLRLDEAAGRDLFARLMPLFQVWQENGLVSIEGDYLTLTLAGQFWAVNLAQGMIDVMSSGARPQHAPGGMKVPVSG